MRDDFLTQDWADHHGQLSAFLGDLLDQTRITFERLVARAYDAPWRSSTASDRASSAGHQTPDTCA